MMRIKLVGQFDSDSDSFFTGTSIFNVDHDGRYKLHVGEPIEEILWNLDDMLRDGKVEIEFLQSKEEVKIAQDYFNNEG